MNFSNLPNKFTAIWVAILLCFATALAWSWLNKEIHIQTNIFALLPKEHQDKDLEQTQQYINEKLNHQVFLVLDAPNQEKLEQATQHLKQQIQSSSLWQALKPQLDTQQFAQTLYQHHAGLVSPNDLQHLKQQDYAALTEQGLMQMMSPGMTITADLLAKDPLLLFPRFVMGLSQQQSQNQNIEMEQGFATIHHEDQSLRLFTLDLNQSPYNIDYQEQTRAWMQQVTQSLSAMGVKSHWTGTLIFSSFATDSAQNEISTIGLGSTLGIIFLVWFGFRSFRPMLTEFIAVSSGCLVAFVVTHWLFQEIHLMTLVFGASLIGVCVDFSFYFMALQSQHPKQNGFAILKPVLPSLFMGLMTTLVAYIFLSFTPFPGFKQIAVFSIMGLSAAWVTSILLLPRLKALNAQPAIHRLRHIGLVRSYVLQRKKLRYGLMFLILSVSLGSLFFLKSNDDIRNLQSMDAQLKQEDSFVREQFAQQQSNRYFVIHAKSAQQAEDLEQDLIGQLADLQHQGALQSFQAIGRSVPTLQQQQHNIELLQAIPEQDLRDYADAVQLNIADVLAWQKGLDQQPLLSLNTFEQHPLAFLAPKPNERLILLDGVNNPQAIEKLQSAEVKLLQPVQDLSELFKVHRIQAQHLLVYALVALAIGLGLIYGVGAIFALVLPVSLALLSTFAVQAWLGVEINLFSIMGTFLIIGIGVDYAIFYRHGHDHTQVVGMALFLCMMSTLFGFGLLSLSQTYAIHCFGITVLFGVIFSFIYATIFTPSDRQYGNSKEKLKLNNQVTKD